MFCLLFYQSVHSQANAWKKKIQLFFPKLIFLLDYNNDSILDTHVVLRIDASYGLFV